MLFNESLSEYFRSRGRRRCAAFLLSRKLSRASTLRWDRQYFQQVFRAMPAEPGLPRLNLTGSNT